MDLWVVTYENEYEPEFFIEGIFSTEEEANMRSKEDAPWTVVSKFILNRV